MKEDNVKRKISNGLFWNGVGTIISTFITFATGVVLARILTPFDFGIFSIIMIIVEISKTLSESGIPVAILRKPNISEEELNVSFYYNLSASLILTLCIMFFAHEIAWFFDSPSVELPLKITSSIILVSAFSMVNHALLISKMEYKKISNVNILSSFVGSTVGLSAAILGFGFWALLYQSIVKQCLSTILFVRYGEYKPNLKVSKNALNSTLGFSLFLLLSSLLASLQQKINHMVIGKVFTTKQLGFYNRAENINAFSTSILSSIFNKVFVPSLAKFSTEKDKIVHALKKINQATFFISFFAIGFIIAASDLIVLVLLGPKWEGSGTILRLIAISSVFNSVNSMNRDVLIVYGKSNILLKNQFIKILVYIPGILIAMFYGLNNFLYYNILVSFLAMIINGIPIGKISGYGLKDQLKDITRIVFSQSFCIILLYIIINNLEFSLLVSFFLSIIVYGALILFIHELIKEKTYQYIKKSAYSTIQSLRSE